jgi:hypothetical protein
MRSCSSDTKQVVVPPVQQFLSVDVKADREQYQPREEGTLSITRKTRRSPVSAEIALGLLTNRSNTFSRTTPAIRASFITATSDRTRSRRKALSIKRLMRGWLRCKGSTGDRKKMAKTKTMKRVRAGAGIGGGAVGTALGGVRADGLECVSRTVADGVAVAAGAQRDGRSGRWPKSMARFLRRKEMPPLLPQEPAVQVRSDFRSTILWLPDVKTDADGTRRKGEVSRLVDDLVRDRASRLPEINSASATLNHANQAAADRSTASAALLRRRRSGDVSALSTTTPIRRCALPSLR